MAGSFWLRLVRWWPSSSEVVRGARQSRPCLEQLGDRTLLSTSTLNPVVRLLDGTAPPSPGWGAAPVLVAYGSGSPAASASAAANPGPFVEAVAGANGTASAHSAWGAAAPVAHGVDGPAESGSPAARVSQLLNGVAGATRVVTPGDTYLYPQPPAGEKAGKADFVENFTASPFANPASDGTIDAATQAAVGARLQQILNNQRGLGGGDASRGEMEEYWRALGGSTHLLNDINVLVYLLRPALESRGDRRDTEVDVRQADAAEEGPLRPDAAGTEIILAERIDGPGISRSLAAVFREEQLTEEMKDEIRAGSSPGQLVTDDLELPVPQAELLPLEDGSRALVAALVSTTPTESDSPPPRLAIPTDTLTGCPVGLDSSPVAAARPSEPAVPPQSAEAPLPAGNTADGSLPDAAFGPATREGWHDAGDVARPTIRLLDALFVAGIFHLYGRVDTTPARDPWRKQPR
jgi:hypothetical protein